MSVAIAQRRAARSPGLLWQVPVFVLGVTVFVAVRYGGLGEANPLASWPRQLAALREACERVMPVRHEIAELVAELEGRGEPPPEVAPLAAFVLGSAHLRLAELSEEPEAQPHWQAALRHLQAVSPEALSDPGDGPRLSFRLAKARAAAAEPLSEADRRLLLTVLGNIPYGEDAGWAGYLQARLALQGTPPDLGTAIHGLNRFASGASLTTPPGVLARAKLQLGELYFRRKELAAARQWLEQIGPDAPAAVQADGRFLLARIRIAEEDWLGAARDLERYRDLVPADSPQRRAAAYHLGLCKLASREYQAAAQLLAEAADGPQPEAAAAALRRAELLLKEPDARRRRQAVPLLQKAAAHLTVPKDREFRHPLLRYNEIVAVFEQAIGVLLEDQEFAAALEVVAAYRPLSRNGREQEWQAEILAAWATALQQQGQPHAERAAAAAQAFEQLAAQAPHPSQQAEWLRRAATLYRQADRSDEAARILRQAVQLPQLPENLLGSLWAELAETLLAGGGPTDEVIRAFNAALATAGPVATAVRYRLARRFADSSDRRFAPLAYALFEQIARNDQPEASERDYHERAIVEMAHEQIRQGRFADAEVWLRKQLALYPPGPEAPLARLLLGICLVQRSIAPPPLQPEPATAQRLREEALQLFQRVIDEMDQLHQRTGSLGDREAWLHTQAALRRLQTCLLLNTPKSLNDLLFEADRLRDRHRGTVEELIILSLMYHAFKQKGDPVRERYIRDQMKELFDKLPPTAFPASSGEYSRSYWEKVWFAAER